MNERSMDLLRAISAVDESIIEKTAPQEFSEYSDVESVMDKAPKERRIHKIIAAAVTIGSAAACIAVLSVLLPKLGNEKPSPGDPLQTAETTDVTEITTAPYTEITRDVTETTETTVSTITQTDDNDTKEKMRFSAYYDEKTDTYSAWLTYAYSREDSLVIPETYDSPEYGKTVPVVGMDYHLTFDCTATEITFPASMHTFNIYELKQSIWMKEQLKKNEYVVVNGVLLGAAPKDGILRIPDGVTEIAERAFSVDEDSDTVLLKEVYIPASVKTIGYSAFSYQSALTTVHLSEGLETIEMEAFRDCVSLTEMTLPKSLKTVDESVFNETAWAKNCKELYVCGNTALIGGQCSGDIVIPEGVTVIGRLGGNNNITSLVIPSTMKNIPNSAFENYTNLKSVVIKEGVEFIELCAFGGCTSLSSVSIPDSAEKIELNAFYDTPWIQKQKEKNPLVVINGCIVSIEGCKGDIVIPEGVTELVSFEDYDEITSVSIPSSVKKIGQYAFRNCTALKTVSISKGVETIYPCAFSGCINLSDINLPEGLLAIGENAFEACRSLKEIRLPEGLKQIDDHAFSTSEYKDEPDNWKRHLCSSLSSVTIPDSLTYIGKEVFDGTPWMEQKKAENSLVTVNGILLDGSQCKGDVVIPEGVKSIAEGAFQSNQKIVSVTMPDSVKEIGMYAFEGCTALKSLHLSEGLEQIDYYAFDVCTALESVHFPDHAVTIGYGAFDVTKWIEDLRNKKETFIAGGVLFTAKNVSGKYVIPENVHTIYGQAFANNTAITEVVIPSTVKEMLEENHFTGCTALKSVKIEEGMLDLPAHCFTDCPLLEHIELPYSMVAVDPVAFVNCPSVKEIWLSDRIDTDTEEYRHMLEELPDGVVIHRRIGKPGQNTEQQDFDNSGRYYFEDEDECTGG